MTPYFSNKIILSPPPLIEATYFIAPPPSPQILNSMTLSQQGGISFSTNQRFCLHFCPKPIRMRKTLHHMKFVNKRMGLLQSFSANGFLGFCHEIDICCS